MKLIEIYRCLCDETRLRILNLLAQGPLCVCHFQAALELPQVAISKHLGYLRRHGLVSARRHGRWMIYRLPDPRPPELHRHLQCLQDCVQSVPVFRADIRRLKNLKCECECEWVEAVGRADGQDSQGRSQTESQDRTNAPPLPGPLPHFAAEREKHARGAGFGGHAARKLSGRSVTTPKA